MHKKAKFKGECWLWPYALNKQGYGQLQRNGKRSEAHRWLYVLIKGQPPAKSELDHLCSNRACINPEHLQPVSHAENCRRGYNAKLTEQQVVEIKALHGKATQGQIAAKYGVSRATIGYIFQGKRWL